MKIVQWLVANVILLAVGASAAAGGLLVILPLHWLGLQPQYWPWASLPAGVATICGAVLGGRLALRLADMIGNHKHRVPSR